MFFKTQNYFYLKHLIGLKQGWIKLHGREDPGGVIQWGCTPFGCPCIVSLCLTKIFSLSISYLCGSVTPL